MDPAEFDHFADEYPEQHRMNVAITGETPEYFAEYKIKVLQKEVGRRCIVADRILDFGSGTGNSIPHFRTYLPQSLLFCADVSQRSLDLAEARFPGFGAMLLIQGNRIPAADASFAVTYAACVFHHIPHEEHVHWLGELRRVTRPGGMLAIFEHNPLNPLTVRAVNTCSFDKNARLIRARQLIERYRAAGWIEPQVLYHLYFPRAFAALRPLERHLSRFPLGAQYSVTATKSN